MSRMYSTMLLLINGIPDLWINNMILRTKEAQNNKFLYSLLVRNWTFKYLLFHLVGTIIHLLRLRWWHCLGHDMGNFIYCEKLLLLGCHLISSFPEKFSMKHKTYINCKKWWNHDFKLIKMRNSSKDPLYFNFHLDLRRVDFTSWTSLNRIPIVTVVFLAKLRFSNKICFCCQKMLFIVLSNKSIKSV